MNDSLRAFIALPVAPKVVRAIIKCQHALALETADRVRWAPADQIHLTLKFLGHISPADVDALKSALDGLLTKPLRLRAEGIGGFPSRRNPRVIWVGLAGDIDALQELQAAVDKAAAPYSAKEEHRKFHPHLTIGRVREPHRLGISLDPWENKHFGGWIAIDLLLMQSKLSPKGATHSVLASFSAR